MTDARRKLVPVVVVPGLPARAEAGCRDVLVVPRENLKRAAGDLHDAKISAVQGLDERVEGARIAHEAKALQGAQSTLVRPQGRGAEEREVRGLISMTTTLPGLGSWANWILVPPITPMASTISYEYFCSFSWRAVAMVSMGAVQ